MHGFTQKIMAWAAPLAAFGGIGIALVALIDSSFLSLPEVADLYVVAMTVGHPSRWLYYGLMATAGSVAGCQLLFLVARAGGEAFLRKRFHDKHIDRAFAAFRKYGLLTVTVPSILPPPTPFKIFVILAGAAEVTPGTFALAVSVGRAFRYLSEAILARLYGERASYLVTHNLPVVSFWVGVTLAVVTIIAIFVRRRLSRPD
jgi:membrane protein YqaA with SNARE-associated domain